MSPVTSSLTTILSTCEAQFVTIFTTFTLFYDCDVTKSGFFARGEGFVVGVLAIGTSPFVSFSTFIALTSTFLQLFSGFLDLLLYRFSSC